MTELNSLRVRMGVLFALIALTLAGMSCTCVVAYDAIYVYPTRHNQRIVDSLVAERTQK